MTVKDLIIALEEIEDKNLEVVSYDPCWDSYTPVEEPFVSVKWYAKDGVGCPKKCVCIE